MTNITKMMPAFCNILHIYSNDKAIDIGYLREIIIYFCAKNILIIWGQPFRIIEQINALKIT